MCDRYRLSRSKQLVEEYFDAVSEESEWSPRYNVAPTQPVPVIRQNLRQPIRELSLMRWGLIPSSAKDSSVGAPMINARSETVETKPAFREAFKARRCLIPADGYYEWQTRGKLKQPYCFELDHGELFGFAGIWDQWKDSSGGTLETCAILTTTANPLTSAVHDRMPVILERADYDLWLDPGMLDVGAVSDRLSLTMPGACVVFPSAPGSTGSQTTTRDARRRSRPSPSSTVSFLNLFLNCAVSGTDPLPSLKLMRGFGGQAGLVDLECGTAGTGQCNAASSAAFPSYWQRATPAPEAWA
jgi:putative SOS response-associated peptidase YedK